MNWYGQLARLNGNGCYSEYYNKVKAEINRRGGYNTVQNEIINK